MGIFASDLEVGGAPKSKSQKPKSLLLINSCHGILWRVGFEGFFKIECKAKSFDLEHSGGLWWEWGVWGFFLVLIFEDQDWSFFKDRRPSFSEDHMADFWWYRSEGAFSSRSRQFFNIKVSLFQIKIIFQDQGTSLSTALLFFAFLGLLKFFCLHFQKIKVLFNFLDCGFLKFS